MQKPLPNSKQNQRKVIGFVLLKYLLIDHKVDAVTPTGEDVVLQWSGSIICVDDVAGLLVQEDDPFGELSGIGNGGAEKDLAHAVRQEDDRLLPDDTTLLFAHVVDLIKDYPP